MNDQPLVSICIPTYNGRDFLSVSVESALAQTTAAIEILIVDDASTDGTPKLADDYSRRDARVRVVRNSTNLGLVGNWNRCVSLAAGRWIKFLFQDDMLEPHCVESMLEVADSSGREFVFCFRNFVFEAGTPESVRRYFLGHQALVRDWFSEADLPPQRLFELALRNAPRNLIGEPTVTMLSRDLMRRAGAFNSALVHLCDAEYWVRAGSISGIACCRSELATFRVHGASATSVNSASRRFQKEVLDPLLIMHEWLFSPSYAPLRATASNVHQLARLERTFWDACHDASKIAADCLQAGDSVATNAWTAIQASHPRIARIPISRKGARVLRRAASALGNTLKRHGN